MKSLPLCALAAALTLLMGACVHTPPGTSVEVALARKPELLRLPAAATPAITVKPPGAPGGPDVHVPAVEPALPEGASKMEQVAEAYAQAKFCQEAGQDDEAQASFEKAVDLDPSFADAWKSLAMIYEKKGEEEKARDAFRHAKTFARQ